MERMWKKVVVAEFKIISQHVAEGIVERYKKSHAG
jgi:hypothetical protein